jgi:phenylacetate-CoA ligase
MEHAADATHAARLAVSAQEIRMHGRGTGQQAPDTGDHVSGGFGLGAFDPWQSVNAAWDVWTLGTGAAATIEQRSRARLAALLDVLGGSPLYRRLHGSRCGRTDVPLVELPPVTRAELMAGFDDWCRDPAVTLEAATAFTADPQRVGGAFLGRYAVWTSSGTTGTPGIYVQDARALAVYDALETLRFREFEQQGGIAGAMARLAAAPWGGGERFAMLGATGGHFAGNASVERMRRLGPWLASRMRVVSIMQPLDGMVAELNAYRPTVLATYPTAAELLAGERSAGRLTIDLDEVWTGGEQLSAPVRNRIEAAFGCRLRNAYGASEFLAIGWGCDRGAIHVNSDWVLLEPVDRHYRPVPPGTASHTVLLTNLANHLQPLVRYDLGDTVTLLPRCACSSPFPAIHVEGRSDDVLEFDSVTGTPVSLLPLAMVTLLEDDAGVFDFQLVKTGPHTLALRLEGAADCDAARGRCRRVLHRFLDANGIGHVRIVDDPQPPLRSTVSGKLRRIVSTSHPHGAQRHRPHRAPTGY